MAPNNGTTSIPPKLKLVVTLPPNHSTLEWHTTMAPCNGTTSTPPKLVVTLPLNHSTLQWYLRWHPAMAPRPLHPAMAPWCHVQSAKVVRRPPHLLEVRTPIAIAIWGKRSGERTQIRQLKGLRYGSRKDSVQLISKNLPQFPKWLRMRQLTTRTPKHYPRATLWYSTRTCFRHVLQPTVSNLWHRNANCDFR